MTFSRGRRAVLMIFSVGLTVAGLGGSASAEGGDPPPFTWQVLETGSNGSFRGLDAVSDDVAWAASESGEVLRTVDGGATFVDVAPPDAGPDELTFADVEAQSADRALVMAVGLGDEARIYRTTDGGATWKEAFRNLDPDAFYDCMAMFDRKHGVVMGDPVEGEFQILLTADGGRSWALAPAAGIPDALEGEFGFSASGTCVTTTVRRAWFATGGSDEARVFRSDDFGMTWTVASTPIQSKEDAGIFSIDFRTPRRGIAIGGDFPSPDEAVDALALTTDGGLTWRLVDETKAPKGWRSGSAWWADQRGDERVAVPDLQRTVFAVGESGSDVSQNFGRSWESFDDRALHSVDCVQDSLVCWASGPRGRIARLAVG